MDWIEKGMQETDAANQAAAQAAAAAALRAGQPDREMQAWMQEKAQQREAAIDETNRQSVELLDLLGVPELLGDVRTHYWRDGDIVTFSSSPRDHRTRYVSVFHGLEYRYKGLELVRAKTITITSKYGLTAAEQQGTEGYEPRREHTADVYKPVEAPTFDGIFVGVRSRFGMHSAIESSHLIVRAFLGAHNPDELYHFGPRDREDYHIDLLTLPLEMPYTAEDDLGPLREAIQKALAGDTYNRQQAGRFPATVVAADREAKLHQLRRISPPYWLKILKLPEV